jgi:hypothetical protein
MKRIRYYFAGQRRGYKIKMMDGNSKQRLVKMNNHFLLTKTIHHKGVKCRSLRVNRTKLLLNNDYGHGYIHHHHRHGFHHRHRGIHRHRGFYLQQLLQ